MKLLAEATDGISEDGYEPENLFQRRRKFGLWGWGDGAGDGTGNRFGTGLGDGGNGGNAEGHRANHRLLIYKSRC